jgi:tripartite-type tricarboxylate transporter receptor subunit TctC
MKLVNRKLIALAGVVMSIGISANSAQSQTFPERVIRLIVPFSAGGGADAVARIVANEAAKSLGHQIVVDNRGGGGGIIGADLASNAESDGYTLLFGQSGPISINPSIYKSLPYDSITSFDPITMTTSYPYVMVVNSNSSAQTLEEFVDLAKSDPNSLTFGTSGVGGSNHLVSEYFSKIAGIKMIHVPYKGTGPAVTALLGGEIDMVFSDPLSANAHVASGALRPLAVTGLTENSGYAGVPTVDATFPGFEALAWHGVLAPAGTPEVIIDKLFEAFNAVLKDPVITDRLKGLGVDTVVDFTPKEFEEYIKLDVERWKSVAVDAGIEQR